MARKWRNAGWSLALESVRRIVAANLYLSTLWLDALSSDLCSYHFSDTNEHFTVYKPFVFAQSCLVDNGSLVFSYAHGEDSSC